jgi:cytochrome c oxidase assembly factor CtaG
VATALPPLTPAHALATWQFAPAVSAALAAAAAAYLTAAAATRRSPAQAWPARRTLAFLLGLVTVGLATQSAIGAYQDVLFSVHMVQHLLLIMVAPPLLILGRPVTLVLEAARGPLRARAERVLRPAALSWLPRPAVVVPLYAAVIAGTHLTPLMDLVVENPAVRAAEQVLYLVTGCLYFLPVVGSGPARWRLPLLGRYLLLLAAMPADTVVGVILMLVPRELFPAYALAGRTWGPSPVADLHQGGLIMFAGGDLIMAVLGVVLAAMFVREGDRPETGLLADLAAYNASLAALGGKDGTTEEVS